MVDALDLTTRNLADLREYLRKTEDGALLLDDAVMGSLSRDELLYVADDFHVSPKVVLREIDAALEEV